MRRNPVLAGGLQPGLRGLVVLVDRDRVAHPAATPLHERLHDLGLLVAHPDHHESLADVLVVEPVEVRDRLLARTAPGRPELDEMDLARLEAGDVALHPLRHRERRGGTADLEGGLGLGGRGDEDRRRDREEGSIWVNMAGS